MTKIILVTHAAFVGEKKDVHGPAHSVHDYLNEQKIPHVFLRHPIYGGFSSLLEEKKKLVVLEGKNLPVFLRPFWESVINLKICWQNRTRKPIFIGVDPLNALSGYLAKLFGWAKTLVFYTPDYTEKRFGNKLLNSVYHAIDKFCSQQADQVWCVSQRIVAVRKGQNVPRAKLFYVPNTPGMKRINRVRVSNYDKNVLVAIGNVNKTVNYSLVIESLTALRKEFSDIKFLIVGQGDYMDDLKKQALDSNLDKQVIFLGSKSHDEVLKILKSSGIGLALYSGEFGTNLFGDSMKIREYLACGLPVVTTDVTETARIVKTFKAGEVIGLNKKEFMEAVTKILSKNYLVYKKNALRAAAEFDFDKMISIPLKKIL